MPGISDHVPGAPTIDALKAMPAFASLSDADLRSLAPLFTTRAYARDAIISVEGERVEELNFILSGRVQAYWSDEEGHQLKLGIDEPGMHFPDQAALTGEPTLVSHIAVSELRLAAIRRDDLLRLMERHPHVATTILMDVAARLRRMIARSRMLTMDDVYGRVVKLLRGGADGSGRVAERLTHAEIGQRVGATREMVGRVLRDLVRGGYIEANEGRIVILKKLPDRW